MRNGMDKTGGECDEFVGKEWTDKGGDKGGKRIGMI